MARKRQDHEPPEAVARRGWRYHHLGIPTTVPRPDELHLEHLKLSVSGFASSPFGIEWMRFDEGCTISDLIRTVPHVAFEVDDIDEAIKGLTLLGDVSSPSPGVRVAMIVDNGAPVELIEFARNRLRPSRRTNATRRRSARSKRRPPARHKRLR